MADPRLLGLFKFGEKAHIDDFVAGSLYMNTVGYFRKREDDELRSDPSEGLAVMLQPTRGGRISLQVPNTTNWFDLPNLTGPIRVEDNSLLSANLFCMYGLTSGADPESPVDPRNFAFGDTFVCVLDGNEFLTRVRRAVENQNLRLNATLVEYFDYDTHHGDVGPFRKRSEFSHQSEYRIAILGGSGKPRRFEIGSLADITSVGDLAQLNQLIRIT